MPTTVTVTAIRAWITDPSDPGGASVVCGTRRTSEEDDIVDGEFEQYVGGSNQLRTFPMTQQTFPVVLAALTPAQLDQIRAWKGRILLVRTTDGLRVYGGYLRVGVTTTLRAGAVYDAAVTLQRVSRTDALP